jgi:cobalt-zinc-cadmium efflux system membrane fusion protein
MIIKKRPDAMAVKVIAPGVVLLALGLVAIERGGWALPRLMAEKPVAGSTQKVRIRVMRPVVAALESNSAPLIAVASAKPVELEPSSTVGAAIDPAHVVDVRASVEGRIVSAGSVLSKIQSAPGVEIHRSLHPGDKIKKGQVLATLWSPRVGERKSRFLAAASRLMFDEASIDRLRLEKASASTIAEAERHCRMGKTSLARAEQALRETDFTEDDIAAVRRAAAQLHLGQPDYSRAETWAEVELRAPHDGVLLQASAAPGGAISEGAVLFRIALDKSAVDATGASDTLDDEWLAAEDRVDP